MTRLTAGLYGKLPAHGDFVRRGWDDAVIDGLDAWLAAGLEQLRGDLEGERFAARMRAAPAWHGFVPAHLGGAALHLALAPSTDRAGRLFFLTAGVSGSDEAVAAHLAHAPGFVADLDELVYAAVAGTLDGDMLLARLAAAVRPTVRSPGSRPAETVWWPLGAMPDTLPAATSPNLDASLMEQLMGGAR